VSKIDEEIIVEESVGNHFISIIEASLLGVAISHAPIRVLTKVNDVKVPFTIDLCDSNKSPMWSSPKNMAQSQFFQGITLVVFLYGLK